MRDENIVEKYVFNASDNFVRVVFEINFLIIYNDT